MRASLFPLYHFVAAGLLAIFAALAAPNAIAQDIHIDAELVAEGPVQPGESVTLAIAFTPESEEWHGYWSNPGDAGLGMVLDWTLPGGWEVGAPQYPVPQRLIIADLMNHIYEGDYAVLVELKVPENAAPGVQDIALTADYLACTDQVCVPQTVSTSVQVNVGGGGASDPRFAEWRAAIPPMLDVTATDQVAGDVLRLAIPLPASLDVGTPHIFIENKYVIDYNAAQSFTREGDVLIAEIPLSEFFEQYGKLSGIIAFDDGMGLQFASETGRVAGTGITRAELAPLWLLLLGALAGGLLLNIMPCVFPILSLKALSLVRASHSESQARAEGLAYTAGVIVACLALGGLLLALRAAGEQIGWAFQLQQPGVVAVLLALAVAITANFAGLFELPAVSITRGGKPAGAFATGLLAAFVATPCTGPFMAAALGAALLLPAHYALLLFAALGLGLALPFLALGFIPGLRRMLPKPGAWMETFRKIMTIPMGLTALALLWLCWRIGGVQFALLAGGLAALVSASFVLAAKRQASLAIIGSGLAAAAIIGAMAIPPVIANHQSAPARSILDPQEFSQDALARARRSGQPVFLWFTADWCVTCKVNEGVAVEREATRAAFEQAGVIAMRGDWTTPDPAISSFLTEQGAAGVPLYLWYDAKGRAQNLPQVLTPDSLVTLAKDSQAPASAGSSE